jgi:hypothetical protein
MALACIVAISRCGGLRFANPPYKFCRSVSNSLALRALVEYHSDDWGLPDANFDHLDVLR